MPTNTKKYDSFLNIKKSVELPSNLLSLKKHSLDLEETVQSYKKPTFNQTRYLQEMPQPPPSYVEEKADEKRNKSVLYKRLSGIRGENKELGNLSFSKMLSRMVVMEDDEEQSNFYSIEQRIKHPTKVKPI